MVESWQHALERKRLATAIAHAFVPFAVAQSTNFVKTVRKTVCIIKRSSLDSIQFTPCHGLRTISLDYRFKDQSQIVTTRHRLFGCVTILV